VQLQSAEDLKSELVIEFEGSDPLLWAYQASPAARFSVTGPDVTLLAQGIVLGIAPVKERDFALASDSAA